MPTNTLLFLTLSMRDRQFHGEIRPYYTRFMLVHDGIDQ
ncbi:hypothetical protein D083_0418 [Dickeya solani RNS 08.23.3.1.A]|nr:hypothetical protein D083_0418 [Dickeya solani RNS 08.23.3.1.A]